MIKTDIKIPNITKKTEKPYQLYKKDLLPCKTGYFLCLYWLSYLYHSVGKFSFYHNFHDLLKPIFWEKQENTIYLTSAEISQSVVQF